MASYNWVIFATYSLLILGTMLTYCHLNPQEPISVIIESKYTNFQGRKSFWKCFLKNNTFLLRAKCVDSLASKNKPTTNQIFKCICKKEYMIVNIVFMVPKHSEQGYSCIVMPWLFSLHFLGLFLLSGIAFPSHHYFNHAYGCTYYINIPHLKIV